MLLEIQTYDFLKYHCNIIKIYKCFKNKIFYIEITYFQIQIVLPRTYFVRINLLLVILVSYRNPIHYQESK